MKSGQIKDSAKNILFSLLNVKSIKNILGQKATGLLVSSFIIQIITLGLNPELSVFSVQKILSILSIREKIIKRKTNKSYLFFMYSSFPLKMYKQVLHSVY